jgi:hypothetical protein
MGARYVFWRSPDGRPYSKGDGKHAPSALLKAIGENAFINAEGNVSWRGFGLFRMEPSIQAAVAVCDPEGEELNDVDAWNIVRAAIAGVIKKHGGGKPVIHSEVIEAADRKAAEHFRKDRTDYVLISSLSVKKFPAKTIRIGGCEIAPLRSRGRFRYPEVVKFHARHTSIPGFSEPSRYHIVRVATKGRTIHEATARALDALSLLRGLWTLFATHGQLVLPMGNPQTTPVGVIHVGPLHTLHLPDGAPADDQYWYEPSFVERKELFDPSSEWARVERNRRWALRRIQRLPFRRDVEDLLIRYAVALDSADFDVTLLQSWGLLEKMTDTIGAKYEETVRRATWGFRDRNAAMDLLESLRLRRNQYVHSGKSGERRDQMARLMKSFVDPHLLQLIRNDLAVQSLKEYASCLALPGTVETLEKERRRRGKAMQVLKRWDKSS